MLKITNFISAILLIFSHTALSQNNLQLFKISEINIEGNIKTKAEVILRELEFKISDTLNINLLETKIQHSKNNLLKTPLFNSAEINYSVTDSVNISVKINVSERWYLWPEIAFYYVDRNFSNWLKEWNFNHLDYGGGFSKYNFRGRNEKIELFKIFGYNRMFIINYKNIYIDKNRNHAISLNFKATNRKETSYVVENDQIKWLRLENNFALTLYSGFLEYTFRPKLNFKHSFIAGYEYRTVADTIIRLNPNYFFNAKNKAEYFFIKYIFVLNTTNSSFYPLTGNKFIFTLKKNGLGFQNNYQINNLEITADYSKFFNISPKLFLSNNLTLRTVVGNNNAFFINSTLGYLYNIRGFEYNVISGKHFVLQKNTLNFEIIPKKIFNIKFIPYKSISQTHLAVYLSAFTDFAYVNNNDDYYNSVNSLTNKYLFAYGAGINFLTYYDKLLRIEFSMTNMKTSGFFIHFEAPF